MHGLFQANLLLCLWPVFYKNLLSVMNIYAALLGYFKLAFSLWNDMFVSLNNRRNRGRKFSLGQTSLQSFYKESLA